MRVAATSYKVFTDPIHGFVQVPKGLILRLVDHPYVQRLRRIRQLGLGYLVFPGSEHSRFSHALGALGLMQRTLASLKEKNTTISNDEMEGTMAAILLHDIGHGPFSHTLESTLISDFHHEQMTLELMKKLNEEFDGALGTAISIFTGQHPKPFLHQLISSQLDIDRLDYIKRDSMFTGVIEGGIGIDRIIKTLRVRKGQMVIERKGIYAIENYITARRLMHMQVYQHKTVLGADKLLRAVLLRVKDLVKAGKPPSFPSPALHWFLTQSPSAKKELSEAVIANYLMLDDNDIIMGIKFWTREKDRILADLCNRFLERRFFRTTFLKQPLSESQWEQLQSDTQAVTGGKSSVVGYYLFRDNLYNEAYRYENDSIWVFDEPDTVVEFSKAADTKSILALTQPVVKPYIVHMKEVKVF